MSENVLPFRFKWVSASPDPHNKTMRNNLEPQEIFVEVNIPVKHTYMVNSEAIIKEQLGVDVETASTAPILTPEGMKYALEQLSLQEVAEPVSDDEWDDAEEDNDADWDEDSDDTSDDADEDWDDDEDLDWDE